MKALFFAIMLILSTLNGNEMRYDTGVVASKTYHEVGDYTDLHIVDSKGNEWVVSGTIAPIDAKCIIEFNTNGTTSIFDDEITSILYLDTFEEGK